MSVSACLLDKYGSAGHGFTESALTSIKTLDHINQSGGKLQAQTYQRAFWLNVSPNQRSRFIILNLLNLFYLFCVLLYHIIYCICHICSVTVLCAKTLVFNDQLEQVEAQGWFLHYVKKHDLPLWKYLYCTMSLGFD